ncbi:MAG: DUF2103 domain-containing protein [Spirochaetes bacterium]|nr:DUF2103 domain-containing protein [Spirochaetota bacterium]
MSRYRKKGVKRQHTVLKDFVKFLESFTSDGLAQSIIPGRISTKGSKSSSGENIVELQYETKTGLKLLLKKGTTVQEVFVVTSDKDKIKDLFKEGRIII